MVSVRGVFQNHLKNLTDPKLLNEFIKYFNVGGTVKNANSFNFPNCIKYYYNVQLHDSVHHDYLNVLEAS